MFLTRKEYDEAEKTALSILDKYPHQHIFYYDLGMVWEQRGNTAKALEFYNLCLKFNPNNQPALDRVKNMQTPVAH